jgi:hypothetical protein
MGNSLDELASYFRPVAEALIAALTEAGLEPVIIDTGRTPTEQVTKLAQGVSWTPYSKHEPQPPEGKSEAIDIAPKSLIGTKLWSPESPLWARQGAIGKSLGLRWGGDWTHVPKDPSHFEKGVRLTEA